MHRIDSRLYLSATDLAGHLGCTHLTELNHLVAEGKLAPPRWRDPRLEVLAERGRAHERAYLEHLRERGLEVLELEVSEISPEAARQTKDAMRRGVDVISQAVLIDGGWRGRADVMLRRPRPSDLGEWSYEAVDAKLASETRAGTILQLCLYSEMIERIQRTLPEQMHVVSPEAYADPEYFRTRDFLAYHRRVKADLEASVAAPVGEAPRSYPEPVPHCDVCRWWKRCDERRRADDHLSLVAGVTRLQRRELEPRGIDTLAKLGAVALPLAPRPLRGSAEAYERVRDQARLQLESRGRDVPVFEAIGPIEVGRGLARLPAPSPGDIFFDFEGDPFVAGGGREYLFGWIELDEAGGPIYEFRWALDGASERRELEAFVDRLAGRIERFPDLHVYHFGAYEPAAIKRLMGRHATREDEIDRLLRSERFVDLHAVVRQAFRIGVERYSLKDL